MVTHDPAAAAIADRVVFLRDGCVAGEVAGGDTQRVIEFLAALHAWTRAWPRAMLRTFDALALRQLRSHRLRSALTALGVVLGVGMLFGVLVLVGTIQRTFTDLIGSAYGKSVWS
jgi:ABC-type sugar transport system ATPase subunit